MCVCVCVCWQEELEALFIQLDKAKGRATTSLGKSELGDALRVFFRVGQPGGKTEERYDELMQVPSLLPVLLPSCHSSVWIQAVHALGETSSPCFATCVYCFFCCCCFCCSPFFLNMVSQSSTCLAGDVCCHSDCLSTPRCWSQVLMQSGSNARQVLKHTLFVQVLQQPDDDSRAQHHVVRPSTLP